MKKFLIAALVGATILGGSNLIASETTKTAQETTNVNTQQSSLEQLQAIQDKLNDGVDDKVAIEEFGSFIDTIDLEQYQPMSSSEVEALLND